MKTLYKISISTIVAVLVLVGCDGAFDSLVDSQKDSNPLPQPIEGSSGSADFSNYVAMGNSTTAGFMDASLYNLGQQNSLAALMNNQFVLAGGSEVFNQPDINSVNGFNIAVSNPANGMVLGRFKLDTSIPGPSPVINGDPIGPYAGSASNLNNFGMTGARVNTLINPDAALPGTTSFNPYYARVASSPGTSTIISDVISTNPTFFSLWIGSNDVLGFALAGASNSTSLTATQSFQQDFGTVINSLLTQTNAKGVVGSIPPILALPYFRAIPYNVLNFDAETAAQLNAGFAGYNMVLDGLAASPLNFTQEEADARKVFYSEGNNPVLIHDPNLSNIGGLLDLLLAFGQITPVQREALRPLQQTRQMRVSEITGPELVLFTASTVLGQQVGDNPAAIMGVSVPLPNQFHLTSEQIIQVETARGTFNAIMQQTVQAANTSETRIAWYDANATSSVFSNIFGLDGSGIGTRVDGLTLRPDFSPNGVFSTDGVHPNSRGNALVANDFINAINATFGASVPHVPVLRLPSVQVCVGDCVSQQAGVLDMNIDYSKIPFNN